MDEQGDQSPAKEQGPPTHLAMLLTGLGLGLLFTLFLCALAWVSKVFVPGFHAFLLLRGPMNYLVLYTGFFSLALVGGAFIFRAWSRTLSIWVLASGLMPLLLGAVSTAQGIQHARAGLRGLLGQELSAVDMELARGMVREAVSEAYDPVLLGAILTFLAMIGWMICKRASGKRRRRRSSKELLV